MNGPEEFGKVVPFAGAKQGSELERDLEPKIEPHFEQQLARALQRVDAPEGFAARLMERAEKGDPAAAGHVPGRAAHTPGRGVSRLLVLPRRQWLSWASGAIAAVLVAGIFVGQHVHERHERKIEAQRQFETASRITDKTLEQVREQLAQQGIQLNGQ